MFVSVVEMTVQKHLMIALNNEDMEFRKQDYQEVELSVITFVSFSIHNLVLNGREIDSASIFFIKIKNILRK